MSKSILITGASGLIGHVLTELLLKKGYKVAHLSRDISKPKPGVKLYKWDVSRNLIDKECISNADIIIHLAGEGIADKHWTNRRKEQIIKSRTASIRLIYSLLDKYSHHVDAVISASGINYYGDQGEKMVNEQAGLGSGFLSATCKEWEQAVDEGERFGLRIAKLRIGMVLAKSAGALPQLAKPIQYGVGAALGSGKQWISWVHLKDAASAFLFLVENQSKGVFNLVAPAGPVTNKEMTSAVAKTLGRPLFLPNIPVFALRIILGEMKAMVLDSVKASSEKLIAEGFEFEFPELKMALKEIYKN
jgi:uncharacterized protein (TIGR01777 family)